MECVESVGIHRVHVLRMLENGMVDRVDLGRDSKPRDLPGQSVAVGSNRG